MKSPSTHWPPTKKSGEDGGSFTLEAAVVLLVFVLGFGIFFSWMQAMQVERTVQLALNKTALEISEYCYPAAAVCDALSTRLEKHEEQGDMVSMLLNVTEGALSIGRGSDDGMYSAADVVQTLQGTLLTEVETAVSSGDLSSLTNLLENTLSVYGDTPKKAVMAIAAGVVKNEAKEVLSHVVAIPLCKRMVPENMALTDPDAYLTANGVVNGIDGIDYSMSAVLPDGNEIRLCAIYEVQIGSSLFHWTRKVIQTATTGSWCEVKAAQTVWKLGSMTRGKKLVALAKKENPDCAVKAGKGFDLYDAYTGKITSVISLNPFLPTYSQVSDASKNEASQYTLQEKKIRIALQNSARDLKKCVQKMKNGETVMMQDGTKTVFEEDPELHLLVYLPQESLELDAQLREIAAAVESATGVLIDYVRKDNALK